MVSERQLLANRLNATHSTGPRTARGKAKSAANAITHGIFAKTPVLLVLGEQPAEWNAFRAAIIESLQPNGTAELTIAERAAHLMWRLQRAALFDASVVSAGLGTVTALWKSSNLNPYANDPHILPSLSELERIIAAIEAAQELLARVSTLNDRDPIAAPVAQTVWYAGIGAINGFIVRDEYELLARFRQYELASPPSPSECASSSGNAAWTTANPSPAPWEFPCATDPAARQSPKEYRDWTMGKVKAGIAFFAGLTRSTPEHIHRRMRQDLEETLAIRRQQSLEQQVKYGCYAAQTTTPPVRAELDRWPTGPNHLASVMRYESHLSRELQRTLELLSRLQTIRMGPSATEFGFVSSDEG